MIVRRLRTIVSALFLSVALVPVRAAEPPHPVFAPAPPGTVVSSKVAYLAGEGMHSQWRGVVSKRPVGQDGTTTLYQWYVSIYQLDGENTYKLIYQSPRDGGPFDTVEKAHGANMWYPMQSGEIVGAAELMAPGIQQLVVLTHQTGADCGSADIAVFGYDHKRHKVWPSVTVENGCALDAKIVGNASGLASLQLSGPYYNKTAPMCCPTKPKATAILKYVNNAWVETPKYYRFFPNAFPH